jgi:hypothetical protein
MPATEPVEAQVCVVVLVLLCSFVSSGAYESHRPFMIASLQAKHRIATAWPSMDDHAGVHGHGDLRGD